MPRASTTDNVWKRRRHDVDLLPFVAMAMCNDMRLITRTDSLTLFTTVTSIAPDWPSVQVGLRTSAGRVRVPATSLFVPCSSNGFSWPGRHRLETEFLKMLYRLITSRAHISFWWQRKPQSNLEKALELVMSVSSCMWFRWSVSNIV